MNDKNNIILHMHTFILFLILILTISKNQSPFLEKRITNLEKRVQNMSEIILEESNGK